MNIQQEIKELKKILQDMEQNPTKIDENIKKYQSGIEKIDRCKDYLNEKSLEVEEL